VNFKKFLKFALPLAGLLVLYLIVDQIVLKLKNPNQMDIVRSMTMDMTVKMPAGSMPVETEKVLPIPFRSSVTYTGSADAYNEVPVFPRTEGWVQSLPVYSGDRVRKGQLLARLDSSELSSRVNEAAKGKEAAHKNYLASLKTRDEAKAHKDHFKHTIEEALADLDYWKREIERAKNLLTQQVISQEEFDREQASFRAAQAKYHQMVANSEGAKSAYQAAELKVESANAELSRSNAALQTQDIVRRYTTIVAPVSGVVMERKLDLGLLVKPEAEIMRIAQIDPIRIQANVSMGDYRKIRNGTPVSIWTDKHKIGKALKSKVTAVFATTDVSTRTTRVEAVVPNPNSEILPGDFVTVAFDIEEKPFALTVPNTALITREQQKAVWVAKDGKAELRYISTAGSDGDRTEVIAGLKAGEEIISRGHRDLKVGDMVVSTKYGKDGVAELPEASVSSNRLNKANNYTATRTFEHFALTVQLANPPPKVGANELTAEIASMHGTVPADLSIEIKSHMPAMAEMPVPEPKVTRLGGGKFRAEVEFSMSGMWQIELTLMQRSRSLGATQLLLETGS
jgi:RND family efflux transporter MFP subunit